MNKLSFNFIPEHIGDIEKNEVCVHMPPQIEILIDGKNQFAYYGYGMYPLDFFHRTNIFLTGNYK